MAETRIRNTCTMAPALAVAILGLSAAFHAAVLADDPKLPTVGENARDFELADLHGNHQQLSGFTKKGPVVLLVLRGFPGYQCPICSRQVGQYVAAADRFQGANASVLMIYPGPAEGLKAHAEEFIAGKALPENFHLLIDPDYSFTNAWNLRWDAPRETAYPSTFVIGKDGTIKFARISKTHGGRAPVSDVLKALADIDEQSAQATDGGAAAQAALERVRRHDFHPVRDGFTRDAALDKHGIAELTCDDWLVRTLAVRDLVRAGASGVLLLLKGLTDENLHVRHVSALALGILPADMVPKNLRTERQHMLEERIRVDPDPLIRSEAAIALGRLGDPSCGDTLRGAAEGDPSRDVRHQCVLALDRISKTQADVGSPLFEAYRSLDESTFNSVSVGAPAADFTLTDMEGRPWTLTEFRGHQPVILIWIFADWCPVCHGEFRDLLELQQEFTAAEAEVVTIQCHEPYRCRVMVGHELIPNYWFAKQQAPQVHYQKGLWWRHLSDPAGAVAAAYGAQPLAFAVHSEYINRPATVIIDKEGIVRFAYYGTYWGDRPTIKQTLDMVRTGDYSFEHPKRLRANP